jgi:hypothetical protein
MISWFYAYVEHIEIKTKTELKIFHIYCFLRCRTKYYDHDVINMHETRYYTLGSLTCGEGGNLSTRDLGFIYVSSAGWVGCEFPSLPITFPCFESRGV